MTFKELVKRFLVRVAEFICKVLWIVHTYNFDSYGLNYNNNIGNIHFLSVPKKPNLNC